MKTKLISSFLIKRSISNLSTSKSQSQSIGKTKSWKHIPGPSSLPIIGQIHHFLPGSPLYECSGFEFQNHLFKNYGPIVKLNGVLGRQPIIFIFEAESAARVLRGENWMPNRPGFQSLEYYRKHYSKHIRDPSKPTGLVNDVGENWKQLRFMVNPILLQTKTIKLYSSRINEIAEDMIKRMKSLRNEKNMIDGIFNVEMNLWALESISVIALGSRLNCFNTNLTEDSPVRKLIQIVHDFFKVVDKLDFKPSLWRYISTPNFRKAMKLYEDQEIVTQHLIQNAKEIINKEIKNRSDVEKGVLEKLLDIDERIAVMLAGDTLFGGVDTIANTMTSTLYLLSKNINKQHKLREKIKSGETSYIKACLKESMRMLPVAMGNIRITSKEYNLLGYDIPKNMYIFFGHQLLSMLESQYPRPYEYLPERWIVDKGDPLYYGNAHPFAYSPFGFGARSCIGKQHPDISSYSTLLFESTRTRKAFFQGTRRRIADLELETFLTKVIESFQVEWFGPPPTFKFSTLNYMVPPYNFVFNDVRVS